MARIKDFTTELTKANDTYFAGDNASQGTGKTTYATLLGWIEGDLNLDPSDVGLGNVTNVQQASKTDFDNHTSGTDLRHTASQIDFDSSNVYTELLTLKNRLNDSISNNDKDIHIVLIDFQAGDASWSESDILAMVGIDNANYANFNYRIDQRFPVYIYELNKVAGHATNVNIATDMIDMTFELTGEGNYHLTTLKVNDNVFTVGSDYRVSLRVRIYKEYFTPQTGGSTT